MNAALALREHVALVRRLAALQQRVGDLLQASARREAALAAENLRLRGERVRMRTAVAWNLRTAVLTSKDAPSQSLCASGSIQGLDEAHSMICQTGCMGHAHPWLDPDGQCRHTGNCCDRLSVEGAAGTVPVTRPGT